MICVSVLEHLTGYGETVAELARVLRPGGRLVLTFDLSLEDRFELRQPATREVFDALAEHFEADAGELWEMAEPAFADWRGVLSTPEVRRRRPELLPWRWPRLQAISDFLGGHGWTGGFRYVAPFCCTIERRRP